MALRDAAPVAARSPGRGRLHIKALVLVPNLIRFVRVPLAVAFLLPRARSSRRRWTLLTAGGIWRWSAYPPAEPKAFTYSVKFTFDQSAGASRGMPSPTVDLSRH